MRTEQTILLLTIALTTVGLNSLEALAQASSGPPNIIVIVADDVGVDMITAYGEGFQCTCSGGGRCILHNQHRLSTGRDMQKVLVHWKCLPGHAGSRSLAVFEQPAPDSTHYVVERQRRSVSQCVVRSYLLTDAGDDSDRALWIPNRNRIRARRAYARSSAV